MKVDVELLKGRLFFDGYNVENDNLSDEEKMSNLLDEINSNFFDGKGNITLIPYFNGIKKEDGGVSGIVLGNGKHFTCHTFSYKNTMFVDYFGCEEEPQKVSEYVINCYDVKKEDIDNGKIGDCGLFGRHIIIRPKELSFDDAKKLICKIVKEIGMTPITDEVLYSKVDEENYDILQPIAESHISIHRNETGIVLDIFSCKWFDKEKLVNIVNAFGDNVEITRGLRWVPDLEKGNFKK